jgi:hypothetical protein
MRNRIYATQQPTQQFSTAVSAKTSTAITVFCAPLFLRTQCPPPPPVLDRNAERPSFMRAQVGRWRWSEWPGPGRQKFKNSPKAFLTRGDSRGVAWLVGWRFFSPGSVGGFKAVLLWVEVSALLWLFFRFLRRPSFFFEKKLA